MRQDAVLETVRVKSLPELDALVGTKVTDETPLTHWVDGQTHFVFPSVEEALEALRDPYYRIFMPSQPNGTTVLTEVKEFRRYSCDLGAAWDVVEVVTASGDALQIHFAGDCWRASFGGGPMVAARTAPAAICLAALQAKGLQVEIDSEEENWAFLKEPINP